MPKIFLILLIGIFFSFLILSVYPNIVNAQPIVNATRLECRTSGDCELNDIWKIVVAGTNIVFGIIGTVVLLMFIYGGFTFMTSAGSKERVTKGKAIIIQSVIGMAIMFLSYTIVGFVFAMLGLGGENFYSTGWFS